MKEVTDDGDLRASKVNSARGKSGKNKAQTDAEPESEPINIENKEHAPKALKVNISIIYWQIALN